MTLLSVSTFKHSLLSVELGWIVPVTPVSYGSLLIYESKHCLAGFGL